MPIREFELINRYFRGIGPAHESTLTGIGDDCAVIANPPGYVALITTDTLVENTHFFAGTDPESLGYKALAVNLSDLAAMGAMPRWASLALTCPHADENWIAGFAKGFEGLARQQGVQLIGGDTTKGALTITVQAVGLARKEEILHRSGAKPGDSVYVTGTLGDAALALKFYHQPLSAGMRMARNRLDRPQSRVDAGRIIAGMATACIDISDGFAADLGHLLEASQVGATVDFQRLPFSDAVRDYLVSTGDLHLPLCGGEDYELCFTLPRFREADLERAVRELNYPCTRVGIIESGAGLIINNHTNNQTTELELDITGYEHFS